MKRFRLSTLLFSLPFFFIAVATSLAQDMDVHSGVITIIAPKNHAVLDSGKGVKLTYDVHLSPSGNHLHVYVDGNAPIIDRDVSHCPCSLVLPDLSPGRHRVEVKEAMVNHVLTGIESTVRFTVK